MSKRFTDTEKWEDSWFRNLLPEYQRFWIYMLDKCDSAGVYEVDLEVAEFFLKQKCHEKELKEVFKDRICIFDEGKRWFIPKFISFQYGVLDPNCRPHNSILKLLRSYKLEGYLRGINTPKTIQDNTRQEKKGGVGENKKGPRNTIDPVIHKQYLESKTRGSEKQEAV